MDRQIVYPGAIPLETDLLNTNKNAMIGLSKLAAAVLGTNTFLNGLACTPTGPASLQVYVAPGEIYSLQNMDGTAYSSIGADTTHAILKQGISLDQLTLSCPAPVTAGQSVNYLIQVAYQDTDSGAVVLPYYNASNPPQAYAGPANSGTAQPTVRKGACVVSAKAGIAATTGTQATPAPDAGYIGAFVVTVAYGQTQITASNISAYTGAPFLPSGGLIVGGLQGNACNISAAGGAADAITGSYTPGITALTNGMTLYVRASSANATTTPTFTPNSGTIAAKTIVKGAGAALAAGDIAGMGHWVELQYDTALDKWVLLNPATGVAVGAVASVQGAFKNLKASATGTNATVTVSADEIVVEDSSNNYRTLRNVALSINSAASGANGLTTATTLAGSTWYAVWVIYNPSTQTTAGLLALSSSAPTVPSGYTMMARVGWIRTDGTANMYPLSFTQAGRRVQYKIGTGNVPNLPVIASGAQGFVGSTATYVAASVANFIPPTAATIHVLAYIPVNTATLVAPSPGYGSFSSANNIPHISGAAYTSSNWMSGNAEMVLEGTYPQNIYYAGGQSACFASVIGWEDNL